MKKPNHGPVARLPVVPTNFVSPRPMSFDHGPEATIPLAYQPTNFASWEDQGPQGTMLQRTLDRLKRPVPEELLSILYAKRMAEEAAADRFDQEVARREQEKRDRLMDQRARANNASQLVSELLPEALSNIFRKEWK